MMQKMVRTTVSLPHYIVSDLKRGSSKGDSFGDQITAWYRQAKGFAHGMTVEDELEEMKKIGSMGQPCGDLTQAIRDARDERSAHLAQFV